MRRLSLSALAVFGIAAAPPLEVGFGETDITPKIDGPRPVYLAGFGHNRKATGVAEPLAARAVVLKSAGRKVALVSVDLVGYFRPEVEKVRAQLDGFHYVLVSSTHTHEGPDTLGLWGPTPFQSGIDPDYIALVRERIVKAVQDADAAARPATAAIGTARAPELLRDTRKPHVVNDELTAVVFHGGDGKPSGLVVVWGCHPETYDSKSPLVSSDFVFHTVRALKDRYGCPVAYFTGAVGGLMTTIGLTVKDVDGKEVRGSGPELNAAYGKALARVAGRAVEAAKSASLTPLEVRSRPLFLPVDNKLYQMAAQLKVFARPTYRWTDDMAKPELLDKPAVGVASAIATEVGWLRLGDLSIATVPGEIYPELVLAGPPPDGDPNTDFPDAPFEPTLYATLPGPHKVMIGLANDEVGYILPRRQWDEKPPFAYGRDKAPYGEVNSLGPRTAPLLLGAFRDLVKSPTP
jgi:hypothetical protein